MTYLINNQYQSPSNIDSSSPYLPSAQLSISQNMKNRSARNVHAEGHLTPTFLSAKALPNCNFVKLPKLSPYTELLFAKLQNCLRIGRGVVAAWYMGIQISQKSRQHVKPAFSLPGSFHCRLYDSRNVSLCCCCDMAFSPTRKFDPYVEPSCYS